MGLREILAQDQGGTGMRKIWVLMASAVMVLVPAGVLFGYNRYFSERANPSAEVYKVRGIDVSAHNGEIDFSVLKRQGVAFAYVKATEGTDFRDRNFVKNAVGLKRAGIAAGGYHFFRFDTDGEMQAFNFIRALKGREFELPPAVDVEEWANAEGIGTGRIMRELRVMLDVLGHEGYEPVIYTNKDGYDRFVKEKLENYPLWICSFSDPPLDKGVGWDIWQYSHRGRLDGIEGYVDMNTLNPSAVESLVAVELQ